LTSSTSTAATDVVVATSGVISHTCADTTMNGQYQQHDINTNADYDGNKEEEKVPIRFQRFSSLKSLSINRGMLMISMN
jgi:hypothetical protein